MKRTRVVLVAALVLILLAPGSRSVAQTPCGPTYRVVAGDTLSRIAIRCGLTLQDMLARNPGINNPNLIEVGMVLTLAESTPPPADTYTVQSGDTLFGIAQRLGTTLTALVDANPQLVQPGMALTVPAGTVTIFPTSGPPGSVVEALVSGFPANAPVRVRVRRDQVEFTVFVERTGAAGGLHTQVAIPSFAAEGDGWLISVETIGEPIVRATAEAFAVTAPELPPGVVDRVSVFLVALGAGDVGCGDAVVPLARDVEPTRAALATAIQELLSLDDQVVADAGLYNALSRSRLEIQQVVLVEGVATIRLVGDFLIGGVCDAPRVEEQLRRTSLQFAAVNEVQVFVNDQPLDELTSAR